MANLLIEAIPAVADVNDPVEQKNLLALAHRLSRALIGNRLADAFQFPKTVSLLPTLFTYRMKQRIRRLLESDQLIRSGNFTQLIQISVYDEGGLSYKMPDHVYTSKSSKW